MSAAILSYCPVFTAIHFKLICLYKDGVAIDKDVLAEVPAQVGNLVIEECLDSSTFKRPVRYAKLLTETHLMPADIIPAIPAGSDQDDGQPDDAAEI